MIDVFYYLRAVDALTEDFPYTQLVLCELGKKPADWVTMCILVLASEDTVDCDEVDDTLKALLKEGWIEPHETEPGTFSLTDNGEIIAGMISLYLQEPKPKHSVFTEVPALAKLARRH